MVEKNMGMQVEITAKINSNQVKKEGEKAGKKIYEGMEEEVKKKSLADMVKVNANDMMKVGEKAGESFGKGFKDKIQTFLKEKLKFDSIVSAIKSIGTAIKDFFIDSTELANKYESAFAGVRKTVDGTEADFKKLDSSLRKMAKEIPVSYEKLASIMELGGQLGVDIQNMEKFTKVIAELGVATNMTAEESAQMLAQFANIMKMDLNDIDRLGATIVDLGNNFATTENDIVNFASRIAGAGSIAGLTESQVMAIATAFSSVGIEAEAGGSAVQKVLLDMNSAVVLGGDNLKKYADILGITVDEFKQLYNEHPEQIFEGFVKGLGESGQQAQQLLSDLGMEDVRLNRAFLSLAQNSDILTEAISRGNQAREENVALNNEAEQRFATTESQLIMLQNERANMMASIGEKLQGISLTWEKIKNTMLEAAAGMLNVETTTSDYTDVLTALMDEERQKLQELEYQYNNTKMSRDEYEEKKQDIITTYSAYKKTKEEELKLIEDEEKKLKELREQLEDQQVVVERQREYVERLNNQWGVSPGVIAQANEKLEEETQKMYELRDQIDETKNAMVEQNEINKINAEMLQATTDIEKQLIETTNELDEAEIKRGEQMQIVADLQDELNQLTEQYGKDNEEVSKKQLELDKSKKELATTEAKVDTLSTKLVQLGNIFNNLGGKATTQKDVDVFKDKLKKYRQEIAAIGQTKISVDVEVGETTTGGGTGGGTKSGGSGKKYDPVAKAKEEAKKIRDEKIKALEQEELDELEKNKRLNEIYTEYKDKCLEIDGKTNDEMLKSAEDYIKEYRKNKQDEIEAEKKAGEDSIKNIEKYGKEIEKLGEKREDYKNEAVKNLREVNKELEDLEKENTQNLADRYLEVEKAIREIEKENFGMKYDSSSIEQLQEYQRQGMDSYGGYDIDKLIEYKKLQEEINLLKENTTEETIKEAQERANLTETEKQLLEYEEKKTQLLEKQAILQATANQGDLGSENKALIEEDGMIKYYDAEKEAYTEITDYKNQELARQLLEKQQAMESEYQLNVEQKEKEEALLKSHYEQLENLYQSDTTIYKGELAKKEKAVKEYVARVKAMLSEIPSSYRAYGGTLNKGVTLVGENGPEAIIARTSSYVQPRNAVANNSTTYNNQSSLSIGGMNIGSFNNIDEMLSELKTRMTYRQ